MRTLKGTAALVVLSMIGVASLSTGALAQEVLTASFGGGGVGKTPTDNVIQSASTDEIQDALRQGLSNAGVPQDDLPTFQRQISREADAIKTAKKPLQGATGSFFQTTPTGVTKYAVSIIPNFIENPREAIITPIHEGGHRTLDEKSVQRVNEAISSGRTSPTTAQQVIDLLICYENSANDSFDIDFGSTAQKTMKELRDSGLLTLFNRDVERAAKVLRDQALQMADQIGIENLNFCIGTTT
jgi:hypothetical protein